MCIPHIGSLIIQKCYKINQYSILHDFVESKHRITNHIWIALALASSGLSEFRNFCKLNIRLFTFATHKKMPQHRPWCPQCRIELQKCSAPPNLETRSSPFVTNANNRLKVFFLCVFNSLARCRAFRIGQITDTSVIERRVSGGVVITTTKQRLSSNLHRNSVEMKHACDTLENPSSRIIVYDLFSRMCLAANLQRW